MAYKFREVKCPFCDHIFMFQENGGKGLKINEYKLKDTNQNIEKTKCPKCNENLFVIPEKLEATDEKDKKIKKIY